MPCKVYAHLNIDGRPSFTLPMEVQQPEEIKFGAMKQAFLQQYAATYPEDAPVAYEDCCFWNQDTFPVSDRSPLALHLWEHNDFFLRSLPTDSQAASALAASQKQRGELSYYYAHDRQLGGGRALVSKPPTTGATAPAAERRPVEAPRAQATAGFNYKQSPFGTDIRGYESITSYTWEDHNDDTVKVLVPLDGVGKLPPEQIRSSFGVRSFELLVDDYNGKKLRFACYKTHGEMKPEECKHTVRANRINLVLRKAKEKDIWFDLFKKHAIGDDDDP
mmetsp:Transcript_95545/g.279406  ORF Transcript_95545/g.279406 Transcript_95545/m.279406 type:complete len:276 (-) Transcript_95545:82-909(-)